MVPRIYSYRFEIFLLTQLFILFGSLLIPKTYFYNYMLPLFFFLNTVAGILLVYKKRRLMWFLIILTSLSLLVFGIRSFLWRGQEEIVIRYFVFFVYHILVTVQIIKQVWRAEFVGKNVVIGVASGYISLGFVAFFLFYCIEVLSPGSFGGQAFETGMVDSQMDSLLYYAYITLLTIGYGDIVPVSAIAQKGAMLTGMAGQFYTVIITAVIVGKFIVHSTKK